MNDQPNSDLVKYYSARAGEYENIYAKPERQAAILESKLILQQLFKDKDVIEVACGTGYWTESIAVAAKSIQAIDINEEVIAIARQKNYTKVIPVFEAVDLYTYRNIHTCNALFAGFIWSHVKLQELPEFVKKLSSLVSPGGRLVIMDNVFVEGSNHPITEIDEEGNTYQNRKLSNGSEHRVLKNFPHEAFLREQFKTISSDVKYIDLSYFWMLVVNLKAD